MTAHFLPVYDLTPFTMLDFPEKTACIVWIAGCNMRCVYCHNPQIVRGGCGKMSVESVLEFLQKRKGLLDGVVLSGGEATLYEGIVDLARTVKSMGYAVKLDTNGSRPDILRQLLDEDLLDYVALDVKAPPAKCKQVTGVSLYEKTDITLDLLCTQKIIPFEVRTTVHSDLLNESDIALIAQDLKRKGYRGTYYVQNFIGSDRKTLGNLPPQTRSLDLTRIGDDYPRVAGRNF